jgi:hypothetical protein
MAQSRFVVVDDGDDDMSDDDDKYDVYILCNGSVENSE